MKYLRLLPVILLAAVTMATTACGDSPTEPKERIAVAVSAGEPALIMPVNTNGYVFIQSTVIGRNSTDDADVIMVRTNDDFVSAMKRSEGNYTNVTPIGNGYKESVTHYEVWELTPEGQIGISWFHFRSRIDPTQKDSVKVIIVPFEGGKG
ncbi:MAG: hypothetical protein AB200_00860 [Parcubacteria bacterium C7867-005]|nr:MAG: hypothetical protein AB200_00860 [Parcubacteria bacterium C7867-005]